MFCDILHNVVVGDAIFKMATKEVKSSLRNARECIKNKDYKEALKHSKVHQLVNFSHRASFSFSNLLFTKIPFGIKQSESHRFSAL